MVPESLNSKHSISKIGSVYQSYANWDTRNAMHFYRATKNGVGVQFPHSALIPACASKFPAPTTSPLLSVGKRQKTCFRLILLQIYPMPMRNVSMAMVVMSWLLNAQARSLTKGAT